MDVLLNIHANGKDTWKHVGSDGYIILNEPVFVYKRSINEPLKDQTRHIKRNKTKRHSRCDNTKDNTKHVTMKTM